MRKKILRACILVFIIVSASFTYAEVVDKIAIVVNGEIITQSEIDRLLAPIYEQYKTMYQAEELVKKLEEARQRVVAQLIEDRLILTEAKKLNIEAGEAEVEARIEEAKKRFPSKEAFESTLAEQHLTIKDLKARYAEQVMIRKLIDQKVGASIMVTPVDVANYYNSHIGEFVQPEEVKLRNILIRPKEITDAAKALELAREISRRLKEGGDFGELAKIYSEGPNASDGGLMGFVKKGDLLPELEKTAFGLEVGTFSDIIQTSVGYHILKVEEKTEERTLALSEVRRDIEQVIFRIKVREKVQGWIEGLKKNAYIAFK